MINYLPNKLSEFIYKFLKPYKFAVVLFVFLAFTGGFWGPFNSILLKNVIDTLPKITNGEINSLIIQLSLIIINFILIDNFTWRGLTYIKAKYAPIIYNNIMATLTDQVFEHSQQFFHDSLSGTISKQITNFADSVDVLLNKVSANFLRGASLLFMSFIAAYLVHPIFCLIMIIWFIFFLFVSYRMSKKLVFLSDKQAKAISTLVGEVVDVIANQNNVRIFSRKNFEHNRIIPFYEKQRKAYYRTYFYSLIMHSTQGLLIAIMMSFSAYFLVNLYLKNLVTVGDFALIFGLSMETGHMMWNIMTEVDEFNKAVGKCKQSINALLIPIDITDKADAKVLKCTKGHIVFDNVKFRYKGSEFIFENKFLEIKPAEKIGLVGYSGDGKSTFVNLILRFYDLTEGRILIDGQNINEVTQDSLRENIAIIPQDPSLFNRTLIDNIRYGSVYATEEDVINAAKKAHAHEFIMTLPNKYKSFVGERGVKLSGGQRQRIAIARAILKNAPILILDEATSQLDSVTESLIQDSLWKLMQNKTTIVIAHRLSTLLRMDRIILFDNGKILEEGTHKELLFKSSLYKKLWEVQLSGFIGDDLISELRKED